MILREPDIDEEVEADPLIFGAETLGRRRWRAQREMRRAVEQHRLLNVRGCHGSSKTYELASIVCEWLTTVPGSRVVIGGPSHDAIKRGVWGEVRAAYHECLGRGQHLGGVMGRESWTLGDKWDASIVSVSNPNAAHGVHGRRVLVVVEEAQGVENPELWAAFKSLVIGPEDRMIANGNPIVAQGYYYEATKLASWHCIRIDGFAHPNVRASKRMRELYDAGEFGALQEAITPEWVEAGRIVIPGSITRQFVYDAAIEWGVDDPRFTARVRGEFPDEGDTQLIPAKLLEQCATITPAVVTQRAAGLDVARFGGDQNVAIFLDEHRKVIDVHHWRGMDLMATAGRFVDLCRRHEIQPGWACIDVCGLGAGVFDRCREAKMQAIPVDFGAAPSNRWRSILGSKSLHLNKKAELHALARYYFRHKLISVPNEPRFRPIWADLTALTYTFDGSGNMKVEDKEKIRESIGRSPDYSDALVIALAATGYVPKVG